MMSPSCCTRVGTMLVSAQRRLLVVVKGDRKYRHRIRVLRRERLGRIGTENRVVRSPRERVDVGRTGYDNVSNCAVPVNIELQHHPTVEGHGGVRNKPVASHLRDEAPQPRTEIHALGVELNRRPRIVSAASLVAKRLVLDVLLQVLQRITQPFWRWARGFGRSSYALVGRRLCPRHPFLRLRLRRRFIRLDRGLSSWCLLGRLLDTVR